MRPRALRRVLLPQAVPALVQAARGHSDEFVRYRALVVLTVVQRSWHA